MKSNGNMKLIDKTTLVGRDGLFSKRGCRGRCQYCDLWSEEGCRVILEAPTVDAVKVVHGRWKPADDPILYNIYGVAECSVCGYEYAGNNTNYCPNCGAKMDGERKDQV